MKELVLNEKLPVSPVGLQFWTESCHLLSRFERKDLEYIVKEIDHEKIGLRIYDYYNNVIYYVRKKDLVERMKVYTIEDLKQQKIAVRTPTEEQFQKIVEYSEKLTDTALDRWKVYKKEMCVDLSATWLQGGCYSWEHYFKGEYYTIIDFDQVIFPSELKVGDKVVPIGEGVQYYAESSLTGEPHGINLKAWTEAENPVREIQGESINLLNDGVWFRASDFKKVSEEKQTEMKKKKAFTVDGSVPLKEALVKELGVKTTTTKTATETWKYLSPFTDVNGPWILGTNVKLDVHYDLGTRYNEALQAFRDYYKEEVMFKKGDIITDDNGKNFYTVKEDQDVFLSMEETTARALKKSSRLATPAEVTKYKGDKLIAEAKKRGYKAGVEINELTLFGGRIDGKIVIPDDICKYQNDVVYMGGMRVYVKGQWSEILPDDIKVGIYTLEATPEGAKFGCQTFSKAEVEAFIRLKGNGVDMSLGSAQISLQKLEDILKRIS